MPTKVSEVRQKVMKKADSVIAERMREPNERLALQKEIHDLFDSYEAALYKKFMDDFSKAADFDFITHKIAIHYGVAPSEVTEKFIDEKIKECKKESLDFFREYEKERGVKLRDDTPEFRREIQKKVKNILK